MNRKAAALFTAAVLTAGLAAGAGPPETVHVTYHVQPGKLEEFLGVLKQHHPACLKLGLVLAEPHLILSGKEDGGKPVVIEILTWIDSDAPDSVPGHQPAVKKIWDRLNALVEKRGDKPGIDIDEMDIVTGARATRPKRPRPGAVFGAENRPNLVNAEFLPDRVSVHEYTTLSVDTSDP